MKKTMLSFSFITLISLAVSAQYNNNFTDSTRGFKKQNLFLGGNLGLGFGTYTNINVSPQIGWHLNPMLDFGGGINFQYLSRPDYVGSSTSYSTFVTGLNILGRIYPFPEGFLQVQPEYNYVSYKASSVGTTYSQNQFVSSLLIGAGASLNGLHVTLFYDVLQNINSPYGTRPFVSFGYYIPLHR